ncbi:RHS repeat-associated core domain-containing protein [Endozoicomonas acroporae]|uniref:RHS repeat-associated core domain-containing protein n=1 Tax=Endozoicomonas acroporae TaxID=1701104 RepID=UPI003D7C0911
MDNTIGSRSYSLGYGYNLAGQITSITYPDGRTLVLTYNSLGQVNQITTTKDGKTQALASNLGYQPFGPLKAMSLFGGLNHSRTFDNDYRLTRLTLSNSSNTLLDLGYDYDLNSNITNITDHQNTAKSQALAYDKLNRLDTASGDYGDLDYDYDPVGNRTQKAGDSSTQTLTYADDSNRLLNTNTASYQYDSNGNIIQKTENGQTLNFEYSDNNRLTKVTRNGETIASYVYNAQGERVQKTADGKTTNYLYNPAGQLIAEVDQATGKVNRQYVYLDGAPIAYIESQNDTDQVYAIHNDHLATPQLLTDSSGNVVWRNDDTPFGISNLDSDNSIIFNLRFPGQYHDQETGLSYNYFRDYDPVTGRYVQSDPIGLAGGMNTYGYVGGNSLSFSDFYGLSRGRRSYGAQGGSNLQIVRNGIGDSLVREIQVYNSSYRYRAAYSGNQRYSNQGIRQLRETLQRYKYGNGSQCTFSGNGAGSTVLLQNHHAIPYQNGTFNHQNHPLVRQAGVNLRTNPYNQFMLGNHSGPHSQQYHRTVESMLNNAQTGVQGQQQAQRAVRGVMQQLQQGIGNGSIRPYETKAVFLP